MGQPQSPSALMPLQPVAACSCHSSRPFIPLRREFPHLPGRFFACFPHSRACLLHVQVQQRSSGKPRISACLDSGQGDRKPVIRWNMIQVNRGSGLLHFCALDQIKSRVKVWASCLGRLTRANANAPPTLPHYLIRCALQLSLRQHYRPVPACKINRPLYRVRRTLQVPGVILNRSSNVPSSNRGTFVLKIFRVCLRLHALCASGLNCNHTGTSAAKHSHENFHKRSALSWLN